MNLPYGSAPTLDWLVNEKGIAPYIPVIDKSKREDGTFSREDFTFDKARDLYTCPAGKMLTTTGRIVNVEQLLYRASKFDCDVCPFKMRCCPKEPARKIPRSIYEDARDAARALGKTEAFEQSCRDRKRVEMLFAHLKRILRLGRLARAGTRRVHSGGDRPEPTRPWQVRRQTAATGHGVRCVGVACVGDCVAAAVPLAAHGKQQALTPSSRSSNRRLLQQNLPISDVRSRSTSPLKRTNGDLSDRLPAAARQYRSHSG